MSQIIKDFQELLEELNNHGSLVDYVTDQGDEEFTPHQHYKQDKVLKSEITRLELECSRNYRDICNTGDSILTQIKLCKNDQANHWPNQLMHQSADYVFALHRFQAFKEILDHLLINMRLPSSCHCEPPDDPSVNGKACDYCQRFGREWQNQPSIR